MATPELNRFIFYDGSPSGAARAADMLVREKRYQRGIANLSASRHHQLTQLLPDWIVADYTRIHARLEGHTSKDEIRHEFERSVRGKLEAVLGPSGHR